MGRQVLHLSAAGWSQLPAWRGEAEDTPSARASLLLTRRHPGEWEGNGFYYDACKDVKVMADTGSPHPYSDIPGVAGILQTA